MAEHEHIAVVESHIEVIADVVERLRSAFVNEDFLELGDLIDELDTEIERARNTAKALKGGQS